MHPKCTTNLVVLRNADNHSIDFEVLRTSPPRPGLLDAQADRRATLATMPHQCPRCELIIASRPELQDHLREAHPPPSEPDDVPVEPVPPPTPTPPPVEPRRRWWKRRA